MRMQVCYYCLATSCEELTHWERPWCWEGLGAGGEGDDRGWDGWMASPTRWTWVWGAGDGQGGLACCDSWGRKESDTTERLNWTEPNGVLALLKKYPWIFMQHAIWAWHLLSYSRNLSCYCLCLSTYRSMLYVPSSLSLWLPSLRPFFLWPLLQTRTFGSGPWSSLECGIFTCLPVPAWQLW